jgi:hypothetical protein
MARYGTATPKKYCIPGINEPNQAISINAMTAPSE